MGREDGIIQDFMSIFFLFFPFHLHVYSNRINHTVILDDPFDDPPGLPVPSRSPSPTPEQLKVSLDVCRCASEYITRDHTTRACEPLFVHVFSL